MALTDTQRFTIRFRLGWSERFFQFDSRLEQAMNALDTRPDASAKITNLLLGTPPGLLAQMDDIDARIVAAWNRMKAMEVGTIKLNPHEVARLERQGQRYVGQLAALLGVEIRHNIYGTDRNTTFAGAGGPYAGSSGHFVGK